MRMSAKGVGVVVWCVSLTAAVLPRSSSDVAGAQCTPGPSPCRATNAVQCLGVGCVGNWDECLIGDEAEPFDCKANGALQPDGTFAKTHCVAPGCTPTCSELCLDENGDPAGDINN